MREGGVLQVRVHLLDDGGLTVGFVGVDGIEVVEVGGGEERVEPPDVEQRALTLILDVLRAIRTYDYSQFPIYQNQPYQGLLTTNCIARWLATSYGEISL